jgi:hypothetical protein
MRVNPVRFITQQIYHESGIENQRERAPSQAALPLQGMAQLRYSALMRFITRVASLVMVR